MPPVCKFWAQGSCRFGDSCRFDHPRYPNTNRYSALSSNATERNSYLDGSSAARNTYRLDKDVIRTDLSTEKPQWILSAYGPVREAPEQLFGGSVREQSFEEMRQRHYEAMAAGKPEQAAVEAQQLYNEAEQQMQTALNDLDGAINYIISAENNHPNRFDVCKTSMQGPDNANGGNNALAQPSGLLQPSAAPNPSNAFGGTSQPASAPAFGASSEPVANGAFGQPSMLGQQPNPFGAPSGPTTGAFGQPSALSQKPNPFGPPSAPTGGGAFGQPSALGQKPNPFGASSGSATGAFGQPSALGQPSAFGAASQAGGAFGRPSVLGDKPNPFGNPSGGPAFGSASTTAPAPFSSFANHNQQPRQQEQRASPFGTLPGAQPNPFGQPSGQSSNSFGAVTSSAPANPFGAASSSAAPAFGAPSPARQTPPSGGASTAAQGFASNPFASAQVTTAPANANPLNVQTSQTNPSGGQTATQSPFGAPSTTANPFGAVTQNTTSANSMNGSTYQPVNGYATGGDAANVSSYSSKGPDGRLSMFKGMRVQYRNTVPGVQTRNGRWEKIWFPEGAPKHDPNIELDGSVYDDTTKNVYTQLQQTRSFPNGLMPMLPPKREWCLFDF